MFIDFYWKRGTAWKYPLFILYVKFKKKKKSAHAYFGRLYFLSFLAGKLRHFKRMLLTEFQKTLTHAYFLFLSLLAGKQTKLNGYYLGNSLDEKSWLALIEQIFCWKIFQRTERISQQFCFTWHLLDSTLVQSEKEKRSLEMRRT